MAGFTRKLGRSGIEVSAMGMGLWAVGGPCWRGEQPIGWGEVDDNESIRAIHAALDHGVTFFDTADVYGAGHSERVLGQAMQGKRDQMVIATKFGNTFDEAARQAKDSNADPAYIRAACEASLRRLQTDYIDLYQFHLNGYPAEDGAAVRDVLDELVKAGKIRYFAWSTDFVDRVKVFAESPHCTAVQHRLNVIEDAPDVLDYCAAADLASINRSPLAMGLLTGKFRPDSKLPENDVRGKEPGWMVYFKDGQPVPEWLEKVEAIREVLTSGGRSLTQGALAWIWARSEKTIPIPGCRTVAQVEENSAAMDFGPLTDDQLAAIDSLLGR